MRPLALLAAVLALPAASQPLLGLVPGAPGTASTVAHVEAATGAQTPLGTVRADGAWHPNQPAPVFVDVAGQRAFFVRLFTDGPTGWSLVTADLATGLETTQPWPRPIGSLFAYDARRNRLLSLVAAADSSGGQPAAAVRAVLVSRDPATGDTVHVATVARGVSTGSTYAGESLGNAAAPAVAAGGRLVAVAVVGDEARLASLDLATGETRVHGAAGVAASVAALDAATGDVYRTGSEYVATSDSTWRQRTVLVRDRLDGAAAPDTLATLARNTRRADGTWTVTGLAGMANLGVYDAVTDRVLLNVDGRLRTVDLATGAVTDGGLVGDVRFVGRASARVVAAEAPAAPRALALAASPNPASGMVRLTLAGADAARVDVLSALGRHVATLHDGPVGSGGVAWDARGLPAGVYAVRATTDRGTAVVRVTVAR